MALLDVDGIALHYEVRGTGAPIVLLHGFTSSFAGNWERRGWVQFLEAHAFQIIGMDLRSHGQTTRVYTPEACTTATLANDVVRLLDHLEIDSAHAFGFSMGGGCALQFAMDYPRRVQRLIVGGFGDAAINRFHDPDDVRELAAAFERRPDEPLRAPDAERIRRSAEAAGNELAALLPFLRIGGWPGGLDYVRDVQAQILILVAEDDQYMGSVDELVRLLPHAEVERMPNADHYTLLDSDAVRERVLRFLRAERSD
jgi:pimeloyl-ACP methyl ester carboxylesterase